MNIHSILQSLKVKVARCMVFLPFSRRWFCVVLECNWLELCYGVKGVGGHSLSLMWCLKLLCLNLGHALDSTYLVTTFKNNGCYVWKITMAKVINLNPKKVRVSSCFPYHLMGHSSSNLYFYWFIYFEFFQTH